MTEPSVEVLIDRFEHFPVYAMTRKDQVPADSFVWSMANSATMPVALYNRIVKAQDEYHSVQEELEKYWGGGTE